MLDPEVELARARTEIERLKRKIRLYELILMEEISHLTKKESAELVELRKEFSDED